MAKRIPVQETEENTEEINIEDIAIEDRVARLEMLVETMERKLELLSVHTHARGGRVVVPY